MEKKDKDFLESLGKKPELSTEIPDSGYRSEEAQRNISFQEAFERTTPQREREIRDAEKYQEELIALKIQDLNCAIDDFSNSLFAPRLTDEQRKHIVMKLFEEWGRILDFNPASQVQLEQLGADWATNISDSRVHIGVRGNKYLKPLLKDVSAIIRNVPLSYQAAIVDRSTALIKGSHSEIFNGLVVENTQKVLKRGSRIKSFFKKFFTK